MTLSEVQMFASHHGFQVVSRDVPTSERNVYHIFRQRAPAARAVAGPFNILEEVSTCLNHFIQEMTDNQAEYEKFFT